MKHYLEQQIRAAIQQVNQTLEQPLAVPEQIHIEHTRNKNFGDFASNIAMMIAKSAGLKPRDLAQMIVDALPESEQISAVTIAGPGFINFALSQHAYSAVVSDVLLQGENYGRQPKNQHRINLEFVSSNPTGPLHVGHGRGAAYGSALANLLETAGFEICREYYINDAGRQMDILAVSVWLRYLESFNQVIVFPKNAYKGDYVKEIACQLKSKNGEIFRQPIETVFSHLPQDETDDGMGDKEIYIDALITRSKELLTLSVFNQILDFTLQLVVKEIRDDLSIFNVEFQEWFSERSLYTKGMLEKALSILQEKDLVYNKSGALWFKSASLGDDKDRVLIRENGNPTYFASDLAYFLDKTARGYDELIYIVGADHHGYLARLRAGAQALGIDPKRVNVLTVQFAALYRGEERVQMSTRSGSFVTLRQLIQEVGTDASRFFYLMRKCEQHLDFDLELAKSHSRSNPVYYLQYAHARICRIFEQMKAKGLSQDQQTGLAHLHLLETERETQLLAMMARYPETLKNAARDYEPHQLVHYLMEFSHMFHSFYNEVPILAAEEKAQQARLCLIAAVQQVLKNAFKVLGISAPEHMESLVES